MLNMATPTSLLVASRAHPAGIIRSLTADFLRMRQTLHRTRDQSEFSDSEEVRWVRLWRERESRGGVEKELMRCRKGGEREGERERERSTCAVA